MAVNYGRQGTETVNQANRFFDVSNIVYLKKPDESPFTALMTALQRTQKNTGDPTFKWWNKDKRADSVIDTTGHLIGDTTLTLTSAKVSVFVPEDVIVVVDDTTGAYGEIIRVTGVNVSAGTLTVARGAAGSTAAAIGANDILFRIGDAHEEGSSIPDAVSQAMEELTNHCQIFRHSAKYTRTFEEANRYFAGTQNMELQKKRDEKRKEHVREIEKTFLFGRRGIENAGTDSARRYTGGLDQFIADSIVSGVDNTQDAGGTLTYAEFDTFLGEKAFAYGGKEKWALCSTPTISVLNELTRDAIRIKNHPTSFGLNVDTFESPHGTLHLVRHDMLAYGEYSNSMVVFDPDHMNIRYMGDGMTRFRTDVGLASDDDKKDDWLTEAGLKVAVPETLAKMTNITTAG